LASWDVFHGERLELERGLSTSAVRAALARGELRDDDLVRPAGTTVAWARLADLPDLLEPVESLSAPNPSAPGVRRPQAPSPPAAIGPEDFEVHADDSGANPLLPPAPTLRAPDWFELRSEADDVAFPVIKDAPAEPKLRPSSSRTPEVPPVAAWSWADDGEDDEEEDDDELDAGLVVVEEAGADDLEILDNETDVAAEVPVALISEPGEMDRSSRVALPVVTARGWDDTGSDEAGEDEDDFSLSRSGPATVEELDLAPMVDVAFQLVLFFMVTAQTVLYKTLEIPKPSTEPPPSAVTQGRSRTLEDLKDEYILVEIDASGAMKIDREPVAAEMKTLVERFRTLRETTHRKAMLLSADFATPHRNSVLAYDAANEIGLGIVIARPAAPQGPAPSLRAGQQAAQAPAPPDALPN